MFLRGIVPSEEGGTSTCHGVIAGDERELRDLVTFATFRRPCCPSPGSLCRSAADLDDLHDLLRAARQSRGARSGLNFVGMMIRLPLYR